MYCEMCGCEAPTRYVAFHQNIGLLVMRLYNGTEGNLCKPCIHKTFWKYTAVNMTVGWWGIVSLIVTPCFQLNNMVRYVMCVGLESPQSGAAPPELNDAFFQKIQPHTDYLVQRLNQKEDLQAIAEDVAMRAGVTPGQVALFIRVMIAQARQQP